MDNTHLVVVAEDVYGNSDTQRTQPLDQHLCELGLVLAGQRCEEVTHQKVERHTAPIPKAQGYSGSNYTAVKAFSTSRWFIASVVLALQVCCEIKEVLESALLVHHLFGGVKAKYYCTKAKTTKTKAGQPDRCTDRKTDRACSWADGCMSRKERFWTCERQICHDVLARVTKANTGRLLQGLQFSNAIDYVPCKRRADGKGISAGRRRVHLQKGLLVTCLHQLGSNAHGKTA